MPIFILMTKLTPEGMENGGERKARGKIWLNKVRKVCPEVMWIAHYSLLGRYDFMDIYEAPDIETAHLVALISRSAGAVAAESWPALPYDDYLTQLEQLPKQ